ncbi:TetR/AcrR family transcriptional regulator [Saccharothrix mutabilis subsp. mutabilis]|uniref:TetR/AcrR family transcriptional regulator n=1 Tax=Saccharothrix mutabilis subsp. mutabilis TaxID=66855 RepID=A0ABP3EB49_9PSEU
MRADARRNYEQLVEQAKVAFAEHGVDAPLDAIARRAGVTSGTLYRHFPTRLDLVEAVLADRTADLVGLGHHLLTAADPVEALTTWLRAALTHGLTYRGLSATMLNLTLDRRHDPVSPWHAALFDVCAALLARAADAGAITAGATATDVLKMISAIAWATQDSPDSTTQADRLLTLFLTGLRHNARGQSGVRR